MTKSATRVAADKVTFTQAEVTAKDTAARAGRKNLIINGAMQVNQRGATSGITSGYFVDRFTLSACSASAVLTSSTPTEFPTAISVSATSGNPIIFQKIESKSCQGLSGKTVTVSFYAKNISNATTLYVKLQYAGSADSWGSSTTISEQNLGSLTSGWVKYTASWTVPAGGLNGLSLGILCAGTGTFTMGVTGVQLEVGSVATDFEHRSYGEILADCQRYFYQDTTNHYRPSFLDGSGNYPTVFVEHPVPMRATATGAFLQVSDFYYNHNGSGFTNFTPNSSSVSWNGDNKGGSFRYNAISNGQGAGKAMIVGIWYTRLKFNAEL